MFKYLWRPKPFRNNTLRLCSQYRAVVLQIVQNKTREKYPLIYRTEIMRTKVPKEAQAQGKCNEKPRRIS